MRNFIILSAVFLFIIGLTTVVSAQIGTDVGIKANLAGGEVTAVGDGKIVLQTKDGAIEIILSDKTDYKRIPPDNPTLKAAVAASLADIEVGDKLLVTGMVSEDKKTIPAKGIYLITKADIAQKQTKEAEEWKTRGIAGKVVSFNPQTNAITVSVRGLMGDRTVIVTPKDKAEFLRYAPDSVKFSEAKKSSIVEIEGGDAIRALGDKSEDGSTLMAEVIVTGAFKTVGGTIKAIDTDKNEIIISDFQTKKDVTIVVTDSSILKQFPAEMAQRMAQFQGGGMRPPTQGGGQTTQPPPNGMVQGSGGGATRGGGFDDMFERLPGVKVADLKIGEMIAVSSTKGADPNRINAIKLVSGVEPFLKLAQMTGGGNQTGGRGANSNFTIPGLDGFGSP